MMSRPRATVDMSIQPGELARSKVDYLPPAQAVQAIDRAGGKVKARPKGHGWSADTPVSRRREKIENQATQKAQRPAEAPRPALARPARTRTDRLKRQNLAMDRAGEPCACDDKTPCLAHAGITGRRRWLRPE